MKHWKKIAVIFIGMVTVSAVAVLLFGNQKECCLCNSSSHSALCLIDLETGDVLELSLDGPTTSHGTGAPSYAETFSLIRFGSVTGTKQTSPNVIELKVPIKDIVKTPALCSNCRKLLQQKYRGRYVLADVNNKALFPITAGTEITLQGCLITMMQIEEYVRIIVC